ncbi:CapA family protein [Planotetraspora kaengkrachanensis]|uniref:Capsular polysaccharide biosynthesis protein n=1 Tax=Planotetraspora kaengkrachanensis TaxID=575193 RepID=A0A8J3PQG8_9ACTN|nr:CapA family protein [Planotetraspora kaengkrachanensis]GIG78107.1 capsular polysaccharide biosynthesis protein [Planotetraspora kaengkrachanensis]
MPVTIALAGDTMLGRGVAERVAQSVDPARFFSADLLEVLGEADLFVLNLECCVSGRGRRWDAPGKPFHFRAPPQAAELLAGMGVGCVTLANNHALDYGSEALLDTREWLARCGILCVGAGADQAEARRPEVVTAGGLRVGVLGVTDHPADFAATAVRPGVNYADLMVGVPPWLAADVEDLRARADVVVVTPHWGPNMTGRPRPYIRSAARSLVSAGAGLVAGHSAHVFHGVAPPVLYDLGDFINDYIVDASLRNDLGLLFLVTMDEHGPVRLYGVPVELLHCRTRLARDDEWRWIRDRFAAACADLGRTGPGAPGQGATVTDEDGRLVVDMR